MKMNEVIQAILNGIRNVPLSYPEIHCENIAGDNTRSLVVVCHSFCRQTPIVSYFKSNGKFQ